MAADRHRSLGLGLDLYLFSYVVEADPRRRIRLFSTVRLYRHIPFFVYRCTHPSRLFFSDPVRQGCRHVAWPSSASHLLHSRSRRACL